MKTEDVTDEMVDAVEHEVAMGAPAWDMVDPKEIIAASVRVVARFEVPEAED